MQEGAGIPVRRRGNGARSWFIHVKFVGLAGLFGGLASLAAIGLLGPVPESPEGWRLLRGLMRAIFWPCVFGGILVTIMAGICLWLRHPVVFSRQRWFRLKVVLLAVCIPSLHLMARGRVQAFYDAIDDGNLEVLAGMWRGVTWAWVVAFVVLLLVAMVGRIKPRLGQNREGRGGPRP